MDWLLLGRPNIHCIFFRLIKRVLYTGIGAGVGAAVCYPEEANEALVTVEKEGKNAVEMVQALANGDVCVPFRERLFPGKLLEINLPSSASAADMSLVAGRTIAYWWGLFLPLTQLPGAASPVQSSLTYFGSMQH